MKRALIDGTRIAQIVDVADEFEVAAPLNWVEVSNDTSERDTYENGTVVSANDYKASTTIQEAQERKQSVLSLTFKQKRDAGTPVTIGGLTVRMATTHDAQQELREVVSRLSGGGTQKGVTRSGAPVLFTPEIAQQCLDAVNSHHGACNDTEYDHLVAILALNTIADIDAYDVTTDWPGVT